MADFSSADAEEKELSESIDHKRQKNAPRPRFQRGRGVFLLFSVTVQDGEPVFKRSANVIPSKYALVMR